MRSATISLSVSLCLLCGCAEPADRDEVFPLQAIVRSDEGDPIRGTKVLWNSRDTLLTDRRGEAAYRAVGSEGDVVSIEATCPENFTGDESLKRTAVLRRIHTTTDPAGSTATESHSFTCRSKIKPHVLIVRTGGYSALPVKVDGTVVATTDATGIAQVLVTGVPAQPVEVTIDTAGNEKLRPRMPSRRFTLPFSSRFLVFDQQFLTRKPRKKHSRPVSISGPTRL